MSQKTAINKYGVEIKNTNFFCKTLSPKIKGNEKKVQEKLEQKMKSCWDMFGAGTYENSVFKSINLFGGGKDCFTCYTTPIQSTRGFKLGKDSITGEEFMQSIRESGTLDYIQTGEGKGRLVVMLEENKGIQPEGLYAISYQPGLGECTLCAAAVGSVLYAAGAITVAAVLIAFPEPAVTTAAGAAILGKVVTAAATTAVAGGAVAITDLSLSIGDNVMKQTDIDTILFTDISNLAMANLLRKRCNFVEGVDD